MFASASLPLLLLLEAQAGSTAPPGPPAIVPPRIMTAPPPGPPPAPRPAVQPPVAIDAASWIRSDDYPIAARAALAEGRTTVRYEVRPDGRVGTCTVTESSGNAELDGASCTLLRTRARFRPARDAAGRPVYHMARQTIVWRLPEAVEPMPLVAGHLVIVIPMWRDNGQLGCGVRLNRPELGPLADDLCVTFYPDDAGAVPAIRIIAALALGDAALPAPRATGPRLGSDELRFEVAGDGRVRNCAPVSPPGSTGGLLICGFLEAAGHSYFEGTAAGAAPRRARIRIDVYRESGGPPAPAG